jgi:hypothetical protein
VSFIFVGFTTLPSLVARPMVIHLASSTVMFVISIYGYLVAMWIFVFWLSIFWVTSMCPCMLLWGYLRWINNRGIHGCITLIFVGQISFVASSNCIIKDKDINNLITMVATLHSIIDYEPLIIFKVYDALPTSSINSNVSIRW